MLSQPGDHLVDRLTGVGLSEVDCQEHRMEALMLDMWDLEAAVRWCINWIMVN